MLSTCRLQTIVCTSRIAEAEAFYRDTLGLKKTGESEGAVVFDVSGSCLRVSPVSSTRPTEHTVVGFAVDDLDATVAWLTQRGVSLERFEGFPHDDQGTLRTPGGSRVAWFRDPDGNLLSVVQFD